MVWTNWRHYFSEAVWSDFFLFNGGASRDRQNGIEGVGERDFGFLGAKWELTASRYFRFCRRWALVRHSS